MNRCGYLDTYQGTILYRRAASRNSHRLDRRPSSSYLVSSLVTIYSGYGYQYLTGGEGEEARNPNETTDRL